MCIFVILLYHLPFKTLFYMLKSHKQIDRKTKAKIRIFLFKVPKSFYFIMLEKAKIKGMSLYENNKSYIEFLGIKSKYYNLISIEKTSYEDDFSIELKFIFEKLTNSKCLFTCL